MTVGLCADNKHHLVVNGNDPSESAWCTTCGRSEAEIKQERQAKLADAIEAFVMAPDIWEEIADERERAHAKHGETSMESMPADDPTGRRYRILMEECGEVAQEFNDAEHERRPVDLAKLRKELIQVAAMAGAWADACGRSI